MELLEGSYTFDWDRGNKDKNFFKHGVTNEECEEVFFDPHKRILKEALQVGEESRYILIGRTKQGRALFVVFTMRGHKVRVISARGLNKKERKWLHEKTP